MASTQRGAGPGLVLGTAGGVVATIAMLFLGMVTLLPTPAELIAEGITVLTPLEVFEAMISTFGSNAKLLLFGTVLAGQVAVGAGFGLFVERRRLGPLERILGITAVLTLVGVAALPLLGAGPLGSGSRAGAEGTLLSLAVGGLSFALTYEGLFRFLNPSGFYAEEDAAARRAFLRNAALGVGGLAIGVGGLRWLIDGLTPPPVSPTLSREAEETNLAINAAGDLAGALAAGIPGLVTEITPNDKFYVVSKNVFRDPEVNAGTWRLEVGGLVRSPMTLTYDQMKRLPSARQYFTLQCISNEVGGELIGNAEWTGVWVADLLRETGIQPGAVDVVFRAADDYADSLPIGKALQAGTMLAYEMNGTVLPVAHGFPTRLLVPDIYGMKNVKWVTKIEVLDYDFKGYWQTRGWSDVATMNTTSRIDVPKNNSNLRPGPNYIGGVALAGQRGIRAVEVSTDGGSTWASATMKRSLGPNTWVLWLHRWDMAAEQEAARILVRATDGTGAIQSASARETLPDGASGYHAITIKRAAA